MWPVWRSPISKKVPAICQERTPNKSSFMLRLTVNCWSLKISRIWGLRKIPFLILISISLGNLKPSLVLSTIFMILGRPINSCRFYIGKLKFVYYCCLNKSIYKFDIIAKRTFWLTWGYILFYIINWITLVRKCW